MTPPAIGWTRTEEDFVAHITRTIDLDPSATWIFVADQLNTHKSEGLVRLVAERCGIDDDLGTGVLRILLRRDVALFPGAEATVRADGVRGDLDPVLLAGLGALDLDVDVLVVAE